jgi:hypothetical protein
MMKEVSWHPILLDAGPKLVYLKQDKQDRS